MPKKDILLLDFQEGPWKQFLEEFFEDTKAALHTFHDAASAGQFLNRHPIHLAFVNDACMSMPLTQKLKTLQLSQPDFRTVQIQGNPSSQFALEYAARFAQIADMGDFRKCLIKAMPLPERIRILVIDDEVEIGAMIREYFENRQNPSFQVFQAFDGVEGLEKIQQLHPDAIILDIKMPKSDGREVYAEMVRQGIEIPVIIFFDAISGEELKDIYQIGRPVVMEKGSKQSSPPEMIAIIEKAVFFS